MTKVKGSNLYFYFIKAYTSFSTLLVNVLIARILSQESFGIFALMLQLTFLLNLLSDWSFSSYGPLYYKEKVSRLQKRSFLFEYFSFKSFLVLVTVTIYLLMILFLYNKYFTDLVYGSVLLFSSLLNIDWILRMSGRIQIVVFRQFVQVTVCLITILLAFLLKSNAINIFKYYSLGVFFSYLVYFKYFIKNFNNYFKFISSFWKSTKLLFSQTKYVFIGTIFFNLIYSLNTILLGLQPSPHLLSFYSSIIVIFSSLTALLSISQDVLLPYYQKSQTSNYLTFINKIYFYATCCIVTIISLLFFYFHLIFPSYHKLSDSIILSLVILSISFGLRFIYMNNYLVSSNYLSYFKINLISFVLYILFISLAITNSLFIVEIFIYSIVLADFITVIYIIWISKKIDRFLIYLISISILAYFAHNYFTSYSYLFVALPFFFLFSFLFIKNLFFKNIYS